MKAFFIYLIIGFGALRLAAQERVLVLDSTMFNQYGQVLVSDTGHWLFKEGHDPNWAYPETNTDGWNQLRPSQLDVSMADEGGNFEGWFRIELMLDSSIQELSLGLVQYAWASTNIYLDGELLMRKGNTEDHEETYKSNRRELSRPTTFPLIPGEVHTLAIHVVDKIVFQRLGSEYQNELSQFLIITHPRYETLFLQQMVDDQWFEETIGIFTILTVLFFLLYFLNRKEYQLLFIAVTMLCFVIGFFPDIFDPEMNATFQMELVSSYFVRYQPLAFIICVPLTLGKVLYQRIFTAHWVFAALVFIFFHLDYVGLYRQYDSIFNFFPRVALLIALGLALTYIVISFKKLRGAQWALFAGLVSAISCISLYFILMITLGLEVNTMAMQLLYIFSFVSFPLSLVAYVAIWFRQSLGNLQEQSDSIIHLKEEKQQILQNQNIQLEQQVEERTAELENSLENLKATQTQLIHAEKMASLGELTAGIAHEIQNPLNFVNNFSDLNIELLDDLKEAIRSNDQEEIEAIYENLKDNEGKITFHGKRAEEIVKSMLQHSRGGEGKKEPTDINVLADEYLRLAYHGLRARDKNFNAEFKTDLDPTLPKIEVVPQDIGRVLLNLINNAFQAVHEKVTLRRAQGDNSSEKTSHPDLPAGRQGKLKGSDEGTEKVTLREPQRDSPLVVVSTKTIPPSKGGQGDYEAIQITISDNGPGIPEDIQGKIFQPFFTTKETGQGTGLGLSMSYDIITKGHGGTLSFSSTGTKTQFVIVLPFLSNPTQLQP